jgi:serine/threonine protein kinase
MWSVGCVLFELATGNLLFPLSDARKRFVNHDNKAGQEDLEPSLMTEMTALLGGEAEALCDSWTPSERKRKGREWRAKRHRRKRKGDEGRGLDSSSLSPPADGGRRGRHRHTKVLFWDETVGGDYHREGRMTNISLTTTSGSSDMDMDASSDDSSTETTATDVAMQDSAEDCTRVFLAYKKGERMHIFGRKGESYWRCWLRGKEGLVPVAHLRLLTPFRCVSAEDSESEEEREETEEESKGGGYAASELKWMRAKERERAIRHKQVDITLRQLVKLLRINDFIFADFLMQFLIYDPKRRYTPQEVRAPPQSLSRFGALGSDTMASCTFCLARLCCIASSFPSFPSKACFQSSTMVPSSPLSCIHA